MIGRQIQDGRKLDEFGIIDTFLLRIISRGVKLPRYVHLFDLDTRLLPYIDIFWYNSTYRDKCFYNARQPLRPRDFQDKFASALQDVVIQTNVHGGSSRVTICGFIGMLDDLVKAPRLSLFQISTKLLQFT